MKLEWVECGFLRGRSTQTHARPDARTHARTYQDADERLAAGDDGHGYVQLCQKQIPVG